MKYEIPEEYYFRLHHVRPRFKNDVENVLIFMASEIAQIPESPSDKFKEFLNSAIRKYPGNFSKTVKTINNWRTEISSLFGLLEYSEDGSVTKPGRIARMLAENQDLVSFFRHFLYSFQYPGGHLKSHLIKEYVQAGIKFRPVSYILELLKSGTEIKGKDFGINKAEATHCMFNDLRVTRDSRKPEDTARLIIENRDKGVKYDWEGDVTRYAGDILDYMVLAGLMDFRPNSYFYPNGSIERVLDLLRKSKNWFSLYDSFYGNKEIETPDIEKLRPAWFSYVNQEAGRDIFATDLGGFIKESPQYRDPDIRGFIEVFKNRVESGGIRTDEIREFGEAICHKHEVEKAKFHGMGAITHLIVRIPTRLAAGYDIKSIQEDERHKYIEVKTTISNSRIRINRFHLTTNEWRAAETLDGNYFVYRLMINRDGIELFVIRDPIQKYKDGIIDMIPRDGADITYNNDAGETEKLYV